MSCDFLNAPGAGLINPRASMCGKNINTASTDYTQ